MKNIAFASIKTLRELLAKKEVSAQELVQASLQRIAQHDKDMKSFIEVYDQKTIMDKSIATGVLQGIPGAIKDNICQQDRIASCGSKMLENFTSTYDATAISRLKQQGALLIGRTNMDEFAMGSSTETSYHGKTQNPWNKQCVPGGSSGGSAAAVAAGLVPWALGSDTGGSVRQPAAYCGIVGLKPTYGSVSRYGLIAYASSLDQIGVFARDVYDTATVFSVIAGADARDSSTLRLDQKDYTLELDGKMPSGLRIGIVDNALQAEGMDEQVQTMIEAAGKQFESLGAVIKRVTIPALDYAAACYFIVSRAEAASNLARYDGVKYGFRAKDAKNLEDMYLKSRGQGFGKEVQLRIMMGNYVLSAGHAGKYYNNAKLVQRLIRKEFNDVFQEVDIVIIPSQAAPAFKFGAYDENKLQMDLQDYFTAGLNLAGIPGMSIPCGITKEGMPIGMQLVGPHVSEQLLFKVGHAYQQVTDWHLKRPQLD